MTKSESIWILDSDTSCIPLYHQTLGLRYAVETFADFNSFASAFRERTPRLIIADPEVARDQLANFFRSVSVNEKKAFPDTVIVTRLDEIELIRFYLQNGARDYLLKPLRPNELVAKVEHLFQKLDNRSVLIFRNNLDGQDVQNLTFREHQILTVFLNSPSRLISRDEMIDTVWNKTMVSRKTLDVHVFNLRRKLRPIGYDILCKDRDLYLSKLSMVPQA